MKIRRFLFGAILAVLMSPVLGGQDVTDESRGRWPKEAPGGWPAECQMEASYTYLDDICVVIIRTIQHDCSETWEAREIVRCHDRR